MLDGGELGHIGADFANNLLRQVEAEAVHGRDVHPGQAAQVLTDTDGCLFGKVLAVRTTLIGRQGLPVIGSRVRPVWADGGVGALDFEVAGFDLAGIEVVEFERLLEDEEVLLAPGAGEGLGDFVFGFLAARVAQGGEFMGVTLTGDDGADDGQAGLTGELTAVTGQELAALGGVEWGRVAEEASVFGRIAPQQKERLVSALREEGHYVAMIGDGVNDVLSLKKADLGIAMESGSGATRSVADMILLGDSFAALPPAFLEGQRIVSGMRDILRLYLARAVTLVLMILSASVVGVGFPYIPKHITLVALLTIGIPTFAIAVWARSDQSQKRLLASVLHFAFPAGIVTFLFAFALYVFTFDSIVNGGRTIGVLREDIATFQVYAGIDYEIYTPDQFRYEVAVLLSQTVLTVFSVLAGLVLVMFVEPPLRWFAGGDRYSGDRRPTLLALALGLVFAVIMAVPSLRRAFELLPLEVRDYGVVGGALIAWLLALRYTWRAQLFPRFLHLEWMLSFTEDWLVEDAPGT